MCEGELKTLTPKSLKCWRTFPSFPWAYPNKLKDELLYQLVSYCSEQMPDKTNYNKWKFMFTFS